MKPIIESIYFNPYGYLITFENLPTVIARLYEVFTEFKEIIDRSDRQQVFLREDNLRFIINYKFLPDIDSLTLEDVLVRCKFLSDESKEYIKLLVL